MKVLFISIKKEEKFQIFFFQIVLGPFSLQYWDEIKCEFIEHYSFNLTEKFAFFLFFSFIFCNFHYSTYKFWRKTIDTKFSDFPSSQEWQIILLSKDYNQISPISVAALIKLNSFHLPNYVWNFHSTFQWLIFFFLNYFYLWFFQKINY